MIFGEIVTQTNGEFEDLFQENKLELECDIPNQELLFLGDGRRVYRILENLYMNTKKYAMPGTRVYVALQEQEEGIVFSMKNVIGGQAKYYTGRAYGTFRAWRQFAFYRGQRSGAFYREEPDGADAGNVSDLFGWRSVSCGSYVSALSGAAGGNGKGSIILSLRRDRYHSS